MQKRMSACVSAFAERSGGKRASNAYSRKSSANVRPAILANSARNVSFALLVPVGGVAPPSRVYESLVLTLELHRRAEKQGNPSQSGRAEWKRASNAYNGNSPDSFYQQYQNRPYQTMFQSAEIKKPAHREVASLCEMNGS